MRVIGRLAAQVKNADNYLANIERKQVSMSGSVSVLLTLGRLHYHGLHTSWPIASVIRLTNSESYVWQLRRRLPRNLEC
jgi:hypothetical protein